MNHYLIILLTNDVVVEHVMAPNQVAADAYLAWWVANPLAYRSSELFIIIKAAETGEPS